MNKQTLNMLERLVAAGVSLDDAVTLRRISMTLHRWHELECGDGNDYGSWCITRGRKSPRTFKRDPESQAPMWEGGEFIHDDDGKPYMEHHHYQHGRGKDYTTYSPLADKEGGAKKRLASIMAKYSDLMAYVQTDPRGCALYVVRKSDVPDGTPIDQIYNSRGIAIHQ